MIAQETPVTQAIRCGINAGRPRSINEIILDGMTRARQAMIKLKQEGFTVIDVNINNAIPTMQILPCKKTTELIQQDKACYYKWSTLQGAPEKHGQFKLYGVRVVWVEKNI